MILSTNWLLEFFPAYYNADAFCNANIGSGTVDETVAWSLIAVILSIWLFSLHAILSSFISSLGIVKQDFRCCLYVLIFTLNFK